MVGIVPPYHAGYVLPTMLGMCHSGTMLGMCHSGTMLGMYVLSMLGMYVLSMLGMYHGGYPGCAQRWISGDVHNGGYSRVVQHGNVFP